ncbi:MAG: hypothetical protein DPW09_02735 [Anaerolineae bacterium]|nr:hypothetical protein [Anaerolineales bacterium]MCQ3972345.1 hypothetical protein [Anaerolineae bacterium]
MNKTIAVARDEAFCLTYEDKLDWLAAAGVEVAFFSPLRDPALPRGISAVFLSGGWPELYPRYLSANRRLRRALLGAYRQGLPIYAECGGLMYLTESLVDQQGGEHPMLGLLPGRSVMTRQLALGYYLARAVANSWLFPAGELVRGHKFHFSIWTGRPAHLSPAYYLLPPSGRSEPVVEGVCQEGLWASYLSPQVVSRPDWLGRLIGVNVDPIHCAGSIN